MTPFTVGQITVWVTAGAVFGLVLALVLVVLHERSERRRPAPEPVTPEELCTLAHDLTRLAGRLREAAERREQEQAAPAAPRHAGANV